MKLNFYKSYSMDEPELIDNTSSRTTTYIRQNIREIHDKDESGNEIIKYEYDEAKLTKAEYEEYKKELDIIDIQKQRADIDYLALLYGADLG